LSSFAYAGYYLKDDLAFICDQFNFNLYIIHEDTEYTNAIIYWKLYRKNIGIGTLGGVARWCIAPPENFIKIGFFK